MSVFFGYNVLLLRLLVYFEAEPQMDVVRSKWLPHIILFTCIHSLLDLTDSTTTYVEAASDPYWSYRCYFRITQEAILTNLNGDGAKVVSLLPRSFG